MFGAAIAAREGKLLTLATGEFMPKGRLGDIAHRHRRDDRRRRVHALRARRHRARSERPRSGGRHRRRHPHLGRRSGAADRLRADRAAAGLAGVAALARPRHRRARHRRGPRHSQPRGVVRGPGDVAVARDGRRRRGAGRADLRAARRHRGVRLARAGQHAGRADDPRLRAAHDVDGTCGDSAVHVRRVPARRREILRAAPPRAPHLVRLGPRRHGGRGGDVVRVFHAVHRRVGRDDSRARGAAASDAHRRRLSRAVFDRPSHRIRVAWPPVSAVTAADALRHRLAESADRRSLHRRSPARLRDAGACRCARRARERPAEDATDPVRAA